MDFPYQLVVFVSPKPSEVPHPPIGTPIYGGPLGWIPNVAIKRRFSIKEIDESELVSKINDFCSKHMVFGITFTRVIDPDQMPETVIEVSQTPSLIKFHNDFIAYMSNCMESRYPERDGANYYPHMTVTWHGQQVVNPDDYFPAKSPANLATRQIKEICLVKDVDGENSQVLAYFDIKGNY